MSPSSIRTKRWTRQEYERLIELGAFRPGDRLELVGGQVMVREPQSTPHATGIRLVTQALRAAFGPGWNVEAQLPVALDEESEPEPDLAVVAGGPRDYLASHPSRPVLIVEVAFTSLEFDREDKGSLYARAHVPDYWIVNLVDRVLEVRRDPVPAAEAPFGWRYGTAQSLGLEAFISPLAAPHARIAVADLVP